MSRFVKILFLGGLFVGGIIFPHSFLQAADGQGGLTISPAFQEIILEEKDTEKSFSVSLTNNSSVPMALRLSLYDFGGLDDSGGVAFLGASNDLAKKYALASWMKVEGNSLLLGPNESKEVSVIIENNTTLSPGGHYGALMFQVENTPSDTADISSNDISVQQMFSSLVFAKKVGGEIYNLELNAQTYRNLFLRFQERLDLSFKNAGNVHLVPRGIVRVKDPLGRVVAKGIINQESVIILPETLRSYPVQLVNQGVLLIPGRYTLETAYRFDGKDDFSTIVLQFYFIPLPATLGFLSLVGVLGWYWSRRRRKMSEQKVLF